MKHTEACLLIITTIGLLVFVMACAHEEIPVAPPEITNNFQEIQAEAERKEAKIPDKPKKKNAKKKDKRLKHIPKNLAFKNYKLRKEP